MAIEVTCPSCRAVLPAPEEMAGQRIRCADCQALVDVPVIAKRVSGSSGNDEQLVVDEPYVAAPTRKKPREEWDEEIARDTTAPNASILTGGAVAWLVVVGLLSLVGLAILGMAVAA